NRFHQYHGSQNNQRPGCILFKTSARCLALLSSTNTSPSISCKCFSLCQHFLLFGSWFQLSVYRLFASLTDLAEPIQQLTSNNQGRSSREHVPFTLLARKEKCGELLYEKRHYEKGHWACITMREDTYEQSICYGFMRIMRYICQQNSLGDYLGMTLPIVTVVRTDENHSVISHDVTVAYYLPVEHQAQPPQPYDSDIIIEVWPAAVVYTRPFTGPTNEMTIVGQINAMAELLDSPGVCVNDSFIVAGYTNPAHSHRQNEIWFLERR
ncbi:heme-binding protein soul3, partial [Stegastes partitus]|uniref:Heme-binding protein soul3 n=2 Tax=Stegastes partitus TaxID=144197 RepID=A0A9Y4NC73_9TELE